MLQSLTIDGRETIDGITESTERELRGAPACFVALAARSSRDRAASYGGLTLVQPPWPTARRDAGHRR